MEVQQPKTNVGQNTFPQDVREVLRRAGGVPKKLDIDLSIVLTDQPYNLAGNSFYIFSAPNEGDYIGIKVNNTNEPQIDYSVHSGLKTPFETLLITTPAGQTGTMVLLYATEGAPLEILDNRSITVASTGGILDELRGDITFLTMAGINVGAAVSLLANANAARKAICVSALSTNVSSVFIGFDNTVTAGGAPGTWAIELSPGQTYTWDDYRGPIYGIAAGAGRVVGVGQW